MEQRRAEMEAEMEQKRAEMETEIKKRKAEMEAEMKCYQADMERRRQAAEDERCLIAAEMETALLKAYDKSNITSSSSSSCSPRQASSSKPSVSANPQRSIGSSFVLPSVTFSSSQRHTE